MAFLGTIVNFFSVLVLGFLGAVIKKGIPERISKAIIAAVGACVIYIGIDGMLLAPPPVSENSFLSAGLVKVLILVISMVLGTLLGEIADIDKQMNRLGDFIERRISDKNGYTAGFARGFAGCSILFCVGAMAVNGAINDAIGNPDILIAKAVVDGIIVLIMATTLGIGCMFSAFSILIYQGAWTLLALLLSTFIGADVIAYMSIVGSVTVMLIGTNLMGITNVKTANMVPSMFIPLILYPLLKLFI